MTRETETVAAVDGAVVGPDAARWSPATAAASELAFGAGRAPRMGWCAWDRSQRTELGATAADAWYRRCLTAGCRIWAGPYRSVLDAKRDGMDHQHYAHDLPGGQRQADPLARARRAAAEVARLRAASDRRAAQEYRAPRAARGHTDGHAAVDGDTA